MYACSELRKQWTFYLVSLLPPSVPKCPIVITPSAKTCLWQLNISTVFKQLTNSCKFSCHITTHFYKLQKTSIHILLLLTPNNTVNWTRLVITQHIYIWTLSRASESTQICAIRFFLFLQRPIEQRFSQIYAYKLCWDKPGEQKWFLTITNKSVQCL